jgi:O-antigen/teichoic acid export membrane protein
MAFPLGLALSLQGMVLVIGMTLGSAAVVIFSAYRTLTRIMVQVIYMFNQAVWPEISAAYGAGKMDLVKQIHRKGSSVTFWIALAAVTTLGFIGEWIIGIWTRHAFEQNHTLLLLMLATTLLNVLWQTSWVVLMATNTHQKISIVFVASSASALLLGTITLPILGINGAGWILFLAEIPLFLHVINSALSLACDKWAGYLKSVISNPIKGILVKL